MDLTESTTRTGDLGGVKPVDIFNKVLEAPQVDHFGFRMSLWSGFYTGPAWESIAQRFGLHRDENNVLFSLALYGQLTAKKISEFLSRPKNSISRAIERLLQRHLIRAEIDPTDRRRILLTIEPEGRALYEETSRVWQAREAAMLSELSAIEKVALDALLTKLLAGAFQRAEGSPEDAES